MMMVRVAIFASAIASSGVAAFAPHTPASARCSLASSLELATDSDVPTSEAATVESPIESESKQHDFALLFDCDGVILETEELHRLAYNAVFEEFGVTKVCGEDSERVEWSVGYYDILQNSIGGGKPKMRHYFSQLLRFESNEKGDSSAIVAKIPSSGGGGEQKQQQQQAPKKKKKKKGRKQKRNGKSGSGNTSTMVTLTAGDIDTGLESLIDAMQTRKTELYKTTVEETAIPRPGLLKLMDQALADESIAVGVCSASTKAAAQKVLECTLGPGRVKQLDVCILGDDVSEKKPSPMIYNAAREKLGIGLPTKCVVVEDSAVGLRAAKAAGMRCLITYTASTTSEDFYGLGADAKVPDLVNNGNQVTLESIFAPLREAFSESDGGDQYPELLVGVKDDAPSEEDEEVYDEEDNLVVPEALADEPPATTTLEPTPEETAAFAASEADVDAQSMEELSEESGDDVLPVTLSPLAEEQAFFSSAEAEVNAAAADESPEPEDEPEDEEAPVQEEDESPPAVTASDEPVEEEAPPAEDDPEPEAATEEPSAEAETPPASEPPKKGRILRPTMMQDEMGNFDEKGYFSM